MANLLDVRNLHVSYRGRKGDNPVVKGISFSLGQERLGIVGESGSGKSTIGRALLKLLPTANITAERMQFGETNLLTCREKEMLQVRGRRMSMILQDPKFSLNPVHRVGDQVAKPIAYTVAPHAARPSNARWKCWRQCRFVILRGCSVFIRTRSRAEWGSAS